MQMQVGVHNVNITKLLGNVFHGHPPYNGNPSTPQYGYTIHLAQACFEPLGLGSQRNYFLTLVTSLGDPGLYASHKLANVKRIRRSPISVSLQATICLANAVRITLEHRGAYPPLPVKRNSYETVPSLASSPPDRVDRRISSNQRDWALMERLMN